MLHIMLIEDNTDLATMLQQILEWRGHQVVCGDGGQKGIQLLKEAENLPDVIICDLFMPDLSGHSVLNMVRSNQNWSKIPFVIMSASTSEKDRNEALSHGADDFLVKPFSMQDLDRVLGKWDKPAK